MDKQRKAVKTLFIITAVTISLLTLSLGSYLVAQQKVNINTASAEQLETLPGIGPAKAQAIVEYRKENGNFATIEDLKKVSGIGDKIFEEIQDHITISEEAEAE